MLESNGVIPLWKRQRRTVVLPLLLQGTSYQSDLAVCSCVWSMLGPTASHLSSFMYIGRCDITREAATTSRSKESHGLNFSDGSRCSNWASDMNWNVWYGSKSDQWTRTACEISHLRHQPIDDWILATPWPSAPAAAGTTMTGTPPIPTTASWQYFANCLPIAASFSWKQKSPKWRLSLLSSIRASNPKRCIYAEHPQNTLVFSKACRTKSLELLTVWVKRRHLWPRK